MAWSTPINWAAKAVGYLVTRADLQTISDSLTEVGRGFGLLENASSGWAYSPWAWTYTSATSITITGYNVAPSFPTGTKLLYSNTVSKCSYVVSSSYAGGNTTVNVVGDGFINDAITNPRFSYAAAPYYFPARFSHTPATVGWAATPIMDCDFAIEGRQLIYYFCVDGTSNANTASLTLPVAASVAVRGALSATRDSGIWSGAGTYCKVEAGSSTLKFYIEGLEAAWAVSDLKTVVGSVVIPI